MSVWVRVRESQECVGVRGVDEKDTRMRCNNLCGSNDGAAVSCKDVVKGALMATSFGNSGARFGDGDFANYLGENENARFQSSGLDERNDGFDDALELDVDGAENEDAIGSDGTQGRHDDAVEGNTGAVRVRTLPQDSEVTYYPCQLSRQISSGEARSLLDNGTAPRENVDSEQAEHETEPTSSFLKILGCGSPGYRPAPEAQVNEAIEGSTFFEKKCISAYTCESEDGVVETRTGYVRAVNACGEKTLELLDVAVGVAPAAISAAIAWCIVYTIIANIGRLTKARMLKRKIALANAIRQTQSTPKFIPVPAVADTVVNTVANEVDEVDEANVVARYSQTYETDSKNAELALATAKAIESAARILAELSANQNRSARRRRS